MERARAALRGDGEGGRRFEGHSPQRRLGSTNTPPGLLRLALAVSGRGVNCSPTITLGASDQRIEAREALPATEHPHCRDGSHTLTACHPSLTVLRP